MSRLSRTLVGWTLCIVAGSLPESVAQKPSARPKHEVANAEAQALNQVLDAAQQAIDRQDYASAAQNYQDYLAKKPDDATVHYDLGYAYTALRSEEHTSELQSPVHL